MAESRLSFEDFLAELAATRGAGRKIRLVARYWKGIQQLPTAERDRVALALGSRLAWQRLERLFARDGQLSDDELLIKEAFDKLGSADPEELRELAQQVRQRDQAGLKDRLLSYVRTALEEEAIELEDTGQEGGPERQAEDKAGEAEPAETTEGATAGEVILKLPAAEPFPQIASEPAAATGAQAQATSGPTPSPPTPSPPAPSPPTPTSPPTARLAPRPEAPGVESPTPSSPPLKPQPVKQAPAAESPLPSREPALRTASRSRFGGPAAARVAETPGRRQLLHLRHLATDPDWARSLGPAGRAELVAELEAGWAGRRAVSAMIRGHSPGSLDEALSLVASLERPADRAWCLGDLLATWGLDEAARQAVLAAAPTPNSRRRLSRRVARSPH